MSAWDPTIFLTSLISLFCLAPHGAWAAPVDVAGATRCAISGWSNDHDPAGLNIRAAPRKDGAVIGRIPSPKSADAFGAEFRIIGSRDGWLLIRDAKFADYGDSKGEPILFAGPGWVFADKVRFLINDPDLRGAPSLGAPTVMKLYTADMTSGPDSAVIDHVFACAGDFADVEAHMLKGPRARGWAHHICSNQVTTCP